MFLLIGMLFHRSSSLHSVGQSRGTRDCLSLSDRRDARPTINTRRTALTLDLQSIIQVTLKLRLGPN
jgi:hypothetical protein